MNATHIIRLGDMSDFIANIVMPGSKKCRTRELWHTKVRPAVGNVNHLQNGLII